MAMPSAALEPIHDLSIRPLCPSAFVLAWRPAPAGDWIEIERAAADGDDRAWHGIGRVPARASRYESVGLVGHRSWRHRLRVLRGSAASAWAEAPASPLPDPPPGARGQRIVAATDAAKFNISGSFIERGDGSLLYAYTAFHEGGDYAPAHIHALSLRAGVWRDEGPLFPSRPDWFCVSRPSFARLREGGILATYSIGRALSEQPNFGAPSHSLTRTVARISDDDGRTWSTERVIGDQRYDFEMGNSNGTRNLVLGNGRVITNIHVCKPPTLAEHDPHRGRDIFNEVMGTYLLLSDDGARSWTRVPASSDEFFFTPDDPYGRKRIGFWEIATVEYAPGQLLMYGRTASGWLYETRSADHGSTWTPLARSQIPYPIAPPNLTVIPGTSTIVLLANPHVSYGSGFDGGHRTILATQCSDDAGATWYGYRELEHEVPADAFWSMHAYPDFIWQGDRLRIVHSRRFQDLYYHSLTADQLRGSG